MPKRMSESFCDGLDQLTRRARESEILYREVIEELEMRQAHARPEQAESIEALLQQLRYLGSTEEERRKLVASVYGAYCGT